MKLFLASIATLGLLIAMLFSVLLGIAFFLGLISIALMFFLTIILFFLMWLIGPWISDWIYKFFYKLEWINIQGLKQQHPELAVFVEQTCAKHGIKTPKIGVINDMNPTAFTYGSHKGNARIVFSKGIPHYLNKEEFEAVMAHEIGHIAHWDFVIMAIASLILSLLYQIYIVFARARINTGNRKGNSLAFIGLISFVFYLIASYIVLYLSRIREYYADEFAAENSDPNALSTALIKIAYGIIAAEDSKQTNNLMRATRTIGIFDSKAAKNYGLSAATFITSNDESVIDRAIVYDIKNPWAFVSELSSSHPLTGKRILRLQEMAMNSKKKIMFDVKTIKNYPIDHAKMYGNFFRDLIFATNIGMLAAIVVFAIVSFLAFGSNLGVFFITMLSGFLVIWGLWVVFKTLYRFPGNEFKNGVVTDLVSDVYASPVRGRAIELKGKLTGRGVPGLIFSEDFMFQDKTGIMYLDYQHLVPLIGNLFFAFTKVEKLIGSSVAVRGWFFRGVGMAVTLNEIGNGQLIKSRQKLYGFIGGFLLIALGIILGILILGIF